ncbi:unnamed protein product [Ranitomeya imitator]|uniref:WAP domain-containing protein n=1 Tax=Ranitomeya imitator TaxID=111125 RepID=A0ABN9M4A5_9NEOB|nr:unnamed protein product [Ranitomeya imitator]
MCHRTGQSQTALLTVLWIEDPEVFSKEGHGPGPATVTSPELSQQRTGAYIKAVKSLGINSKMTRIVLFTLCAILANLTSGFVIRKPEGECPPPPPNIRCHSIAAHGCDEKMDTCKWSEKCCFNGCQYMCMKVSRGIQPVPTIPPFYGPFRPPVKPRIPFPYDPYAIHPPPDYVPDFPGVLYPAIDPPNYYPDNGFPGFPGGYNDFP